MKAYWYSCLPRLCRSQVANVSLFSVRFDEESFAKNPDQRLPHSYEPERPVSIDELHKLGVLYWSVPTDDWEPEINRIAKERDYRNRDRLNVNKEGLGDQYEEKLKMFFNELVSIFSHPLPKFDLAARTGTYMKTKKSATSSEAEVISTSAVSPEKMSSLSSSHSSPRLRNSFRQLDPHPCGT